MNPKPIEEAKNPLLARTLPALLRARKRAEALAAATNTAIIDFVDGKVFARGRHDLCRGRPNRIVGHQLRELERAGVSKAAVLASVASPHSPRAFAARHEDHNPGG